MRKRQPIGVQADAFVDLDMRVPFAYDLVRSAVSKSMASREHAAFTIVVAQMAATAWAAAGRWTAISRDRNFYTRTRRYRHPALTHTLTMRALNTLSKCGVLDEQRAAPSSELIFKSRYRLEPAFIEDLQIKSMRDLDFAPYDLVILRNADKRRIDYRDTPETRAMRRELLLHNEAIDAVEMSFNSADWHWDLHGFLRSGPKVVNPRRLNLYRVFNAHWQYGGRLYGGFWQNLPSRDRLQMRLGGELVVEHDFNFIHPTLMAAIAGISLDGHDPYVLPKFQRSIVKSAFNILLNAPTMTSARRAITLELRNAGTEIDMRGVSDLLQAIQDQHPQFSRFWGTGLGLRLQQIDSELCIRILARLRAVGIVALPVHDSFIVPEQASGLLREVMEIELENTVKWLSRNSLKL